MKRRYWVWVCLALLMLYVVIVLRSWYEREIAVEIGGTYEDMRKHSSARFSPLIRGHSWYGVAKSNAQLRFIDPQYGFTTPLASFLAVSFDDNIITHTTMYPHTAPLSLDDALNVVLDLQEQWRRGGWVDKKQKNFPPFADTPEWRIQLRDVNKGGKTYWYAGDKYQATLTVHRFKDSNRPEDERYKIILSVAKPWTPFP
jgi:hypothetical protein